MNLRIELPEELEATLREQAKRAGIAVESFILQLIRERLIDSPPSGSPQSASAFSEWLHQWANRFPLRGHPIDDGRESIYSGRGE